MENIRQTTEVIFFGQLNAAKVAVPVLEETSGALICAGSALSTRGIPLQTAYCAAKHALKGWLDGYRVELMKRGSKVHVTLVMPSSINTPPFTKAKTYMGVMPMPVKPIYEPELAAESILRAAEGSQDKRHQERILARQVHQDVHRQKCCDNSQHAVVLALSPRKRAGR